MIRAAAASQNSAMPAPKTGERGSNQSGMRAYNERLVLSLVRQVGPLAKSQITQMTGLSAQTVSVIMRALEADGLLEKGAPVRGKVGQPSVPMNLRHDGAFFLGLKIGRRSIGLVLTDFMGRVVDRISHYGGYPSPDGVVHFTREAMAALLSKLPEDHRARVAGLGIALPFQLWDWAGMVTAAPVEMEDWRNRDIAADLAGICAFPVFLCNDASAACGAELVFGDQDRPQDFLYFFVSYFVGGGLVLDNTLYTGKTGNAAALGSLPVTALDGSLRQLVDVASLVRLEQALVSAGGNRDEIWGSLSAWHLPADLLDAWLDEAANGLAQASLSASCLIDFSCVLIDGSLPVAVRADLVERTSARLAQLSLTGIETPAVREGSVGSDARSLGAASLPLSERFLVDRNAFLKG